MKTNQSCKDKTKSATTRAPKTNNMDKDQFLLKRWLQTNKETRAVGQ